MSGRYLCNAGLLRFVRDHGPVTFDRVLAAFDAQGNRAWSVLEHLHELMGIYISLVRVADSDEETSARWAEAGRALRGYLDSPSKTVFQYLVRPDPLPAALECIRDVQVEKTPMVGMLWRVLGVSLSALEAQAAADALPPDRLVSDLHQLSEEVFACGQGIESRLQLHLLYSLRELRKNLRGQCYLSALVMAGRVLEVCLRASCTERSIRVENDWSIGAMMQRLEASGRPLDPALKNVANVINGFRIRAAHAKAADGAAYPSEDQVRMVVHAVIDVARATIVLPSRSGDPANETPPSPKTLELAEARAFVEGLDSPLRLKNAEVGADGSAAAPNDGGATPAPERCSGESATPQPRGHETGPQAASSDR